jgi:hypothetical protein
MESVKINAFRSDFVTLAKRLLAVNGYSAEQSFNPHQVKAFVIHNEFGAICVSIGSHLQEALDNAVDNDCLNSCLIEDYDYSQEDDQACFLGNASEPFDLTYVGVLMEVSQYS